MKFTTDFDDFTIVSPLATHLTWSHSKDADFQKVRVKPAPLEMPTKSNNGFNHFSVLFIILS